MDIMQSTMLSNSGVQQTPEYKPVITVPLGHEAKSPQVAEPQISVDQLKTAVEKINNVVQVMAADLKFSVDDETGINVVQVIDRSTHEVIRQIPTKEVVKIASSLDKLQGLLIKQQA